MRLLIIEDEHNIAEPLKRGLEKQGFAVDYCDDGQKGLSEALANDYDCILLDLNLPGIDGIEIAKDLRSKKNHTPILMLTARSQQFNKIEGFEAGTDDYLTKPFHFQELLLRIKALIKRNSPIHEDKLVVGKGVGKIELDAVAHKVTLNSHVVELNNKEFGVLEYLLRNQGRAISQEELLEHVWDSEVDTFTQTVKTNIKTLRQKIDPDKKIIVTKKGLGYVIG